MFMVTKYDIYRMIEQQAVERGLKFEHIGTEIAAFNSLGFLVSGDQKGIFSQGVVIGSSGRSSERKNPYYIWHALKDRYPEFFDWTEDGEPPELKQNFVVFVDEFFNHFFCIPYDILKAELRDLKSRGYPRKKFEIVIENGSYRLKRTGHPLMSYQDTLEGIFRIFASPTVR